MFRSFHPDDQISILTGEVTKVRENGATSGIGVLATYGYDDLGNRTSAAYGNGTAQAFGYDPVSRLTSLTVDLAGTASDLTKTFSYNPASQIVTETRSNDAYAQVLSNQTQTTVTNGLNQLATVNGTAAAYDARGNPGSSPGQAMTTDPATGKTYTYYGSNNQLYTVPSPYTVFSYDALDRLANFNTGAPVTDYVSDGNTPIAEYDASNVLQKRYAFDGSGQPLVQYDAAGNRTWMVGDERGSVIALASDSGAMTGINTYDEYGIPGASNAGTFQYAGMLWLSRAGVYAPTYRAYGAHLGRFGQTDPIGMAGGVNLYGYVGGDPVNATDPLGLSDRGIGIIGPPCRLGDLCVVGHLQQLLPASLQGGSGPNARMPTGGAKPAPTKPKPSKIQCSLQATAENGMSIGLDALALIPGGGDVGAAVKATAGSLSLIASGFSNDTPAQALSVTGNAVGAADIAARGGAFSKTVGEAIPFVGEFVGAIALIHDAKEWLKSYNACMGAP